MTQLPRPALLPRRAAFSLGLAAFGLAGCSLFDDIFNTPKEKLPGRRLAVMIPRRGLEQGSLTGARVTVPPASAVTDWPLAGGTPGHDGGHMALRSSPSPAWSASIGTGGGYRRKITAQPVVAGGRIHSMDSDAVVSAFDTATGRLLWRTETRDEEDRSTNIGGGIATDGRVVFATTGRAEALALDAASGRILWRQKLAAAARSAPTLAEDRLYFATLDNQILALAASDGHKLWGYQAPAPDTTVLGLPAPAYADGIIVCGFGSGDVLALRAATGAVAWGDSLAAARGRTSVSDLAAVRAMAVIQAGRVYAVGLGRLMLGIDLRSGRRLWEREVGSTETPWLAGDWLFIMTTESQLAAISTLDGSAAWVRELDRYENEEKQRDPITWVGPVLAGGRLVVGSTTGLLTFVDAATGAITGTQKAAASVSLTPISVGNTLYVVTDDATLTAYR